VFTVLDGHASMSRSQGRFVFTQLSAIVAFLVTVGIVVLLLGRVVDLESWARERPASALQVLGFCAAGAAVLCIGMLGTDERRGTRISVFETVGEDAVTSPSGSSPETCRRRAGGNFRHPLLPRRRVGRLTGRSSGPA